MRILACERVSVYACASKNSVLKTAADTVIHSYTRDGYARKHKSETDACIKIHIAVQSASPAVMHMR